MEDQREDLSDPKSLPPKEPLQTTIDYYQKLLPKERRLKKYRNKTKQYRPIRTFPNNEKLFYPQLGDEWAKPYKQSDVRETKRFCSKISKQKDHIKKAKWIDNRETELQMFEEDHQVNIHAEGLKVTLKKIANWKTPSLESIHGFWFKKFTSIHDKLGTEMNKCIRKTEQPEWRTKGKISLIPKASLRRNRSKQL